MRVNMDSSIATDPAFKLVAMSLGIDWKQVIGSCFLLWTACYERRSERLRIVEANVAAEVSGFAEALISENLATRDGDEHVIIHGVSKRIEFLQKQAERGAKGGKRSKKPAPRKQKSDVSERLANASETLKHSHDDRLSTPHASAQAYTLTPAPDLSPAPPPPPDRKIHPLARALAVAASEELRSRLQTRTDANGTVLIGLCDKLAKKHHTSDEVRQVIRAKCDQWADEPRMAKHLKPSTLLRLSNFRKYLEEDVQAGSPAARTTSTTSKIRALREELERQGL